MGEGKTCGIGQKRCKGQMAPEMGNGVREGKRHGRGLTAWEMVNGFGEGKRWARKRQTEPLLLEVECEGEGGGGAIVEL
jgi:hypothetical protein